MRNNVVTPLAFSGRHVEACRVENAVDFRVHGRAIVVNLGSGPAPLAATPRTAIPPLGSATLYDTVVEQADGLIVLRPGTGDVAGIAGERGWRLLADVLGDHVFPRCTPLWRSPQDEAGRVWLAPEKAMGEPGTTRRLPFRIRVNLWFAPAGTDCAIHNRHEFIEVHTQVRGLGRMQKFRDPDPGSLYEDVPMAEGATHRPFCVPGRAGGLVYPWHQYRADTDCVWLAVEYHEETRRPWS